MMPCRPQPFSFNKRLYKARWMIETACDRLKGFRRLAPRYDRLTRIYRASIYLATALVSWIERVLNPNTIPAFNLSRPSPNGCD